MRKKFKLKIVPISIIIIFMLAVPCILTAAQDPPCSGPNLTGNYTIARTHGPIVMLNVIITSSQEGYQATGSVTCKGVTTDTWHLPAFDDFLVLYGLPVFGDLDADALVDTVISYADLFTDGFTDACDITEGDFIIIKVPTFESGADYVEFRAILLEAELDCEEISPQ
jgi:hypothetical protein